MSLFYTSKYYIFSWGGADNTGALGTLKEGGKPLLVGATQALLCDMLDEMLFAFRVQGPWQCD